MYLNGNENNKDPLKRKMPTLTYHDKIVICSSFDNKCVIIYTVIEAVSYGEHTAIDISGHYMVYKIP